MAKSVFLNWKGPQGRETIDEVVPSDFPSKRKFRQEVNRLMGEYSLAGMSCYQSTRACSNWKR